MKVLVTSNSFGRYDPTPICRLEEAGFTVITNPYHRQMCVSELIEQITDADAVILSTESITERVLDSAKSLKIISRYGVGLDNIDLDACAKRGIPVTVTRNANSTAVAEYAVALMLAASRGIMTSSSAAKEGIWQKFNGLNLTGKCVGIVGLGAIGREVARLLQGFQVRLLAYDLLCDEAFMEEYHIEQTSLDELLVQSDIVTLHVPGEDGKALLTKERFASMKQDSILINTARASLLDYDALLTQLAAKRLFAAALDVHEHEPYFDKRLLAYENVMLTPHNAAITKEATIRTSHMAVDHILAFFAKGGQVK